MKLSRNVCNEGVEYNISLNDKLKIFHLPAFLSKLVFVVLLLQASLIPLVILILSLPAASRSSHRLGSLL